MARFDRYQMVEEDLAFGEDATVSLPGPSSADGWTLAVYASLFEKGPESATVTGLTAAYTGGATFVITVTIPASATAALTAECTIYFEVWRTDAGNRRPLGRYAIKVYDPVRTP